MKKLLYLVLILLLSQFCFAEEISLPLGRKLNKIAIEYPPEYAYYEKACSKLVNIPRDFYQIVNNALKPDWQGDERAYKLVRENKEAIRLFRIATMQKSEGYIFGKRPKELNFLNETPYFADKTKLSRLTLLEGKISISKKLYRQAEDNYLAHARFILHLSQQKYSILLPQAVQWRCLKDACQCLVKDIQNNIFKKEFYTQLLNILVAVRNNQDFLKSAFGEHLEEVKGAVKVMEELAKDGASFDELFGLPEISRNKITSKRPIIYHEEKSKIRTMKLDSQFFSELNKEVDVLVGGLTKAAIVCTRDNNIESFKRKLRHFNITNRLLMSYPIKFLYYWKKLVIEGKSRKLIAADIVAKVFVPISVVNPKVMDRYHIYHNKLNILILALAVKIYQLENEELPSDLSHLMPKYLKFIPEDTYNNYRPLKYIRSGDEFTIYSFGPDRKDNNGIIEYNEDSKDKKGDIIFSSF